MLFSNKIIFSKFNLHFVSLFYSRREDNYFYFVLLLYNNNIVSSNIIIRNCKLLERSKICYHYSDLFYILCYLPICNCFFFFFNFSDLKKEGQR